MRAFISIDMEGIGGIVREIETDPNKGGEAYQHSRRLMTQEGNAAIEGCVKGGATEILVADSHWNFDNLIPEELHEAATSSAVPLDRSRWSKTSMARSTRCCSSDIMRRPEPRAPSSTTHTPANSLRFA